MVKIPKTIEDVAELAAEKIFADLTAEERVRLIAELREYFCPHCGRWYREDERPVCNCRNDD